MVRRSYIVSFVVVTKFSSHHLVSTVLQPMRSSRQKSSAYDGQRLLEETERCQTTWTLAELHTTAASEEARAHVPMPQEEEQATCHKRRLLKKKPPPLQLSSQNLFVSSHHYEALGTFEVRVPATDVQHPSERGTHFKCSNSTLSPQELFTEFEWDNRVFSITHHGIRLSNSVRCVEDLRFATSNPRKQCNEMDSFVSDPSTQEDSLCESFQRHVGIADDAPPSQCIVPGETVFSPVAQVPSHFSSGWEPTTQKSWMPCAEEDATKDCNLSDFSLCTNTNPNSGCRSQDTFFDTTSHHLVATECLSIVAAAEYPMEACQKTACYDESNHHHNMKTSHCKTSKDCVEKRYCPFPFHSLTLLGTIGIGRTCTVYKARHAQYPDREIAVKVIEVLTSHAQRKSLLKELRVLFYTCLFPHPNIVEFYGACFLDGQVFIGLEYMPMGTYRHLLSCQRRVKENFARAVAFQLVCALVYLHEQVRCIHRDIKPGNILFGAQGQVKLCDFGLTSKGLSKDCHRCKKHTFVGTTLYMAPEMLRGESYDTKIDIWSLGMTVRESLGGAHPFRSILEESTSELDLFLRLEAAEVAEGCSKEDWKVPKLHLDHEEETDAQQLSEEGRDFLVKCLALHAEDRPSAKELLQHAWFEPLRTEAMANLPQIATTNRHSYDVAGMERSSDRLCNEMRSVAQAIVVKELDWQQIWQHSKERSPILWSST